MATTKSVKGGVIIDGRPIGAQTLSGRIVEERGAYFLQVRGRKLEIPVGPLAPKADVAKLAGGEVNVAIAGKPRTSVVAIGTWPTPEQPRVRRIVRILCYIPAPDLRKRLAADAQKVYLQRIASVMPGIQRTAR